MRQDRQETGKAYSGKVMLRVDPSIHARAAMAAKLAGTSLNQWGEEALRVAADRAVGESMRA